MPGAGQPPSEEEKARLRLAVVDAYVLAAERRAEVMEVVAKAGDQEEAQGSVALLLGITEAAALGVLDLRLRRFSRDEVAAARAESEDIRGRLDRGR